MKHSVMYWLLLPPAALLSLFSLVVAGTVLSTFPPLVWGVGLLLAAVGVAWFWCARGRSSTVPGSEISLLGRQSSKEGLL